MQVFENSLWLFFSHPFDVGDIIKYANTRYTVASVKLQKVELTRIDGAHVMIPTEQLRIAMIHNMSRCAPRRACAVRVPAPSDQLHTSVAHRVLSPAQSTSVDRCELDRCSSVYLA